MASYPGTPSKYPVTPSKYPATPGEYPASPAAYPASGPSALAPLSIVTSKTNVFFLVGDLGVTTGTGVAAWANQGPTGATGDATQGTGASQPSLRSAALNGKSTILFDGADDFFVFASLNLPDPDVTATWFWLVFRQVTWTVADSVFGGNATTFMRLFQSASGSPNLQMNSGVGGAQNAGAAVNTWVRGEALFNNSASDYLKLGSTTGAAAATGGNDPGAGLFTLAAHTTTGTGAANIEVAAFAAWAGKPTAGEISELDAWVTAYYGAGVVV